MNIYQYIVKPYRFYILGAFSLAALLVMLLMDWQKQDYDVFVLLQLLPVPFAFMLWLRALGRDAGSLWRHLRLSAVAIVAALSVFGYEEAQKYLWDKMCNATAQVIYFLLHNLTTINIGMEMRGSAHRGWQYGHEIKYFGHMITIHSDYFSLNLFPPCSGLEGVFLFFFLLSVLFMIDWQMFKRMRLFDIYLIAFIYMFLVNALRITAYFLLGNWAWAPDAGDFAKSLRNAPLEMFHSWVGWTVYLGAFALFISVLYRILIRRAQRSSPAGDAHA